MSTVCVGGGRIRRHNELYVWWEGTSRWGASHSLVRPPHTRHLPPSASPLPCPVLQPSNLSWRRVRAGWRLSAGRTRPAKHRQTAESGTWSTSWGKVGEHWQSCSAAWRRRAGTHGVGRTRGRVHTGRGAHGVGWGTHWVGWGAYGVGHGAKGCGGAGADGVGHGARRGEGVLPYCYRPPHVMVPLTHLSSHES